MDTKNFVEKVSYIMGRHRRKSGYVNVDNMDNLLFYDVKPDVPALFITKKHLRTILNFCDASGFLGLPI